MEWYLDRHYRAIVNGAGLDDGMRDLVRRGEIPAQDIQRARQVMIAALDAARPICLDADVLRIVLNTAECLTNADLRDPRWPVGNMWIEFAGAALGDKLMAVRAIWRARFPDDADVYQLIESPAATKQILCRAGRWYLQQGTCERSDCTRPLLEDSTDVPSEPQWGAGCVCQQALISWQALFCAIGMVVRAEGIVQETVMREPRQRRQQPGKPTRADRQIPPQPSIIKLSLSKKYVYPPRDPDTNESSSDDRGGDVHLSQVTEFIRHYDPARNTRWKKEKWTLVKEHIRVLRGISARYIVTP